MPHPRTLTLLLCYKLALETMNARRTKYPTARHAENACKRLMVQFGGRMQPPVQFRECTAFFKRNLLDVMLDVSGNTELFPVQEKPPS